MGETVGVGAVGSLLAELFGANSLIPLEMLELSKLAKSAIEESQGTWRKITSARSTPVLTLLFLPRLNR
jgi:hypothetical protein